MYYNEWKNYKFAFPFQGCEKINQSYSQAWQDIFTLTILKGKINGTYLEIGASDPQYTNNTFLLSSQFGWNGISIDYLDNLKKNWNTIRPNNFFLCADALNLNYLTLLDNFYQSEIIDYLQLDIDPCQNTLTALKKLPLEKYKFRIITFENDIYMKNDSEHVRAVSRQILLEAGYELLVKDVKVWWLDKFLPYEDWYIHPDYVDIELVNSIRKSAEESNSIPEFFLFKII